MSHSQVCRLAYDSRPAPMLRPGVRWCRLLAGVVLCCCFQSAVHAQLESGFTYQGYLEQSDVPANGLFEFTFSLWDNNIAGTQVGSSQLISNLSVEKGLFTVELNSTEEFGAAAFNGQPRWLEIRVNDQTLTPRQKVTPAPYSLHTRGLLVSPTGMLTVGSEVHATGGGFRFPDNTLQMTAAVSDNLGNHIATQNLRLNGNWLSGDGGSEGLLVDQYGNLRGGGADEVDDVFGGSVALGEGARAIGRYSVAIGEGALAEGGGTASFGAHAETGGSDSTAIGFANGGISTRTRADGYSLVIGQNISAIANGGNHNANIAIGTGGFSNTIPQTLMLGMGATVPTMTLTSGSGTIPGRVGIGTTDPVEDVDVRGSLSWGPNASSRLLNDQGGSIELGARGVAANPVSGGTPYIDFHFGNGQAQAFNVRIINEADERLVFGNASSGAVFYLDGRDIVKPANDGRFVINKTGSGPALEIIGSSGSPANIQCNRAGSSDRGGIRFLTGATGYWGVGLYAIDNSNDLVVRNLQSSSDAIRVQSANNNVGLARTATTNRLEVEGNASKTTAGSWLANSDARIKTDIQPVTNALSTLDRVRLRSYRYSEGYQAAHPVIEDRRYLSVIAQEFEEVFPDYVKGSGESLPNGEEILQVDTYPLTIYSAAAIQELHQLLAAQQRELQVLREEVRAIYAKMEVEHAGGSTK